LVSMNRARNWSDERSNAFRGVVSISLLYLSWITCLQVQILEV
jgi:hypothetical protein